MRRSEAAGVVQVSPYPPLAARGMHQSESATRSTDPVLVPTNFIR